MTRHSTLPRYAKDILNHELTELENSYNRLPWWQSWKKWLFFPKDLANAISAARSKPLSFQSIESVCKLYLQRIGPFRRFLFGFLNLFQSSMTLKFFNLFQKKETLANKLLSQDITHEMIDSLVATKTLQRIEDQPLLTRLPPARAYSFLKFLLDLTKEKRQRILESYNKRPEMFLFCLIDLECGLLIDRLIKTKTLQGIQDQTLLARLPRQRAYYFLIILVDHLTEGERRLILENFNKGPETLLYSLIELSSGSLKDLCRSIPIDWLGAESPLPKDHMPLDFSDKKKEGSRSCIDRQEACIKLFYAARTKVGLSEQEAWHLISKIEPNSYSRFNVILNNPYNPQGLTLFKNLSKSVGLSKAIQYLMKLDFESIWILGNKRCAANEVSDFISQMFDEVSSSASLRHFLKKYPRASLKAIRYFVAQYSDHDANQRLDLLVHTRILSGLSQAQASAREALVYFLDEKKFFNGDVSSFSYLKTYFETNQSSESMEKLLEKLTELSLETDEDTQDNFRAGVILALRDQSPDFFALDLFFKSNKAYGANNDEFKQLSNKPELLDKFIKVICELRPVFTKLLDSEKQSHNIDLFFPRLQAFGYHQKEKTPLLYNILAIAILHQFPFDMTALISNLSENSMGLFGKENFLQSQLAPFLDYMMTLQETEKQSKKPLFMRHTQNAFNSILSHPSPYEVIEAINLLSSSSYRHMLGDALRVFKHVEPRSYVEGLLHFHASGYMEKIERANSEGDAETLAQLKDLREKCPALHEA